MKKLKFLSFILAAVTAFSLAACDFTDNSEDEPDVPPVEQVEVVEPVDPNWPVTAFGTEIEKAPEKVAVASPALAEYINDMGLMEKVCAVSDFCNFGGASAMETIGSVRLPDLEAIKTASPDYIITFAQYEESILVEIQQMNIEVIVISAPKTLDELRSLYREIALFFLGAIEGPAFGEEYVAEYDSALAALSYSGAKKNVAVLRALDYMMITGGTMENELLTAAGFANVAETESGYMYNSENWKEFDPEALFINSDIHLIDLESSDVYKKKTAVKGDKVYNVDVDALGLCSKRSFAILKDMLATVYPDYNEGTPLEPAYPSMYS